MNSASQVTLGTMPEYISSQPTGSSKLIELEGLRGWLAWWVVIGHSLVEAGWNSAFLPTAGKLLLGQGFAVKIFIILSGFVITLLLDRQHQSYRAFITGRFFRIFPLYYSMLLCGVLMLPWLLSFYPAYLAHIGNPRDLHDLYDSWSLHHAHLPAYLAFCLTGFHGAVPTSWLAFAQSAFVSQAWSISLEWQFYLLAPLLLWLLRKRTGAVIVGILFYVIIGLRHLFAVGGWNSFLPQSIEFFAVGSASYFAYKYLRLSSTRPGAYARMLFTVTLLAIGLLPFFSSLIFIPWPWMSVVNENLAIGIWFIVLTLAIARRQEPDHPFIRTMSYPLTNRFALYLGRISYSTYLCHYVIIFAVEWMALQLLPGHITKWSMAAIFLTVGTTLTFALSAFLNRFVEAPGMALGKRFTNR